MTVLEARYRGLTGLERMRVARYADLARDLARPQEPAPGQAEGEENDNLLLLAMLLDACHQERLREGRFFPDAGPAPEAGGTSGGRAGRGGRSRGRRGSRAEAPASGPAAAQATEGSAAEERPAPRKRRRRSRGRRSGEGRDGAPAAAAPDAGGD